MQGFYVSLPSTEVGFFKELVRKMGWTMGRNRTITHCTAEEKKLLDEVPDEIRSLIGVAASIQKKTLPWMTNWLICRTNETNSYSQQEGL